MSTVVKDLGAVSAYAYAVEKGYTGTEAEFAELMASYAEVGQTATDAAESALNSKTAAQTAATTATNKASEATTAAQTATTKAGEAVANAEAAARDASQAMAAESMATAKASEATTAAATATTAKDDAVSAKTAAETAQGKAEDAQAAAESVAESIPSDYSQLSEDVSDLKEDFNEKVNSRFGDEYSPNLVESDESMTEGYISKDGAFHSASSMKYTDFIPVKTGWVLTAHVLNSGVFMPKSLRFVACYTESKAVVSSAGSNTSINSFTVPSGIAYVKVTFDGASNYTRFMVSANFAPTEYVPYTPLTAKIEENFLTDESEAFLSGLMRDGISSKNITNKYGCALPQTKIFQTIGIPEKWYNDSMVTPPTTKIAVAAGSAYTSLANDGITFKNNTVVTSANGYVWKWYDAFYALIKSSIGSAGTGRPRRFITENLSDCSLLAIGDSTVDHDTMTATLLSHFTEQGHTLTLLGTLGDGSGSNKNEGRAGWKATDYLTDRQYGGVVNPFYNPTTETFDFAYYMQNQGYTGVDFVVLQLGINDLYNSDETAIEPTWTAMEAIIDSILAYNSGIKIILNLPTTPNSDQSQHNVSEFLYRNRVIRYNEYAQVQSLAKYGTSKVRCSYCHLILDPDAEIRDNVHPTVEGYQKMALEVVNQINCWQNGV